MNAPAKTLRSKGLYPKPTPSPRKSGLWWLLIAAVAALVMFAKPSKEEPFIVRDEKGNVEISPKRLKKFEERVKKIRNAEQYVLLADESGYYPCYNCDTTMIYLNKGEVWRYGTTMQGERGRFGNKLNGLKVTYFVQFRGSIEECLIEEARKIYFYPKLPENLKRAKPLIRPPGNPIDH